MVKSSETLELKETGRLPSRDSQRIENHEKTNFVRGFDGYRMMYSRQYVYLEKWTPMADGVAGNVVLCDRKLETGGLEASARDRRGAARRMKESGG